jgi:RNA polymerase sigma factor (sigma-70 family)
MPRTSSRTSIRAHQALRAGNVPDELRPWLYRLTRNRAIDEVRRKRWGEESLDPERAFAGDDRADPERALRRKESMLRLIDDLAALPVRQREALLARELDGHSPEQVAAQLGVTVAAAQKLAIRARENLVKTRDARDADCDLIRAVLLEAHERGVRPTEHGLRHVKGCDACRAYQRDVRRLSRQLHGLSPAWGLPVLGGVVKFIAGGGMKAAAGTAVAAAAVAVATTGGIEVIESRIHSAGDPAPFHFSVLRGHDGRRLSDGKTVPEGQATVTARVRYPATPVTPSTGLFSELTASVREARVLRAPRRTVTLPCPKGMKLLGLDVPAYKTPAGVNFAREDVLGHSTTAHLVLSHGPPYPTEFSIGIICRRPDRYGSTSPDPGPFRQALERGERRVARVCTSRKGVILRARPGGDPADYINRGTAVAIQRRNRTRTWTYVIADNLFEGWMRDSELCGARPA